MECRAREHDHISNEDYSNMFSLQQASKEAPEPALTNVSATTTPESSKTFVIRPQPILPKSVPRQTISIPSPRKKQVVTSSIKVDSVLRHKAFGLGTVNAIKGGYMVVTFNGIDKQFQFPGAILQGFLSSD